MKSFLARLCFITAALILATGAVMHASAFPRIQEALHNSNLTPFAANSLRTLWLADSATCLLIAGFFAYLTASPSSSSRCAVLLVALIPAATAVMIYIFVGSFFGGHILLAAAVAALAGALLKN
jgi:ABC-type spermidine/putrescine transport system permease subunit I